jgi:hypothetical protein
MRCHRSLLPQVLAGKVNLTMDQAAELARFWQLDERQTAYFLDLVSVHRAGSPHFKRFLEKRLEEARHAARQVTTLLEDTTALASFKSQTRYYSHWSYAAVHVLLSIPGVSTPDALATRLHLPVERVVEIIAELESMGLVRRVATVPPTWQPAEHRLHLGKDSPMYPVYATGWRLKGVERLAAPSSDAIGYSGVHAMSRATREEIRLLLLKALKDVHQKVAPSPEETCICINVDLFDV